MDVNSAEFANAHDNYLDSMADTQDDGEVDGDENAPELSKAEQETAVNCAPFVVEWRRTDGRVVCIPFESLVAAELYAIIVRGSHHEAKIITQ